MHRGSNLPRVGDYNQTLVIDLIRRQPGISRVELSGQTGLTAQTVSNICTRLVGRGLIKETAPALATPGRRRTAYKVVSESRCAIGVHIDPARIVLAVVDLAGQVTHHESFPTPAGDEPEPVIAAIVQHVRDLLDGGVVSRDRLSGLGAATPGPISAATGSVIKPPNLPGWHSVRLRDELENRLGFPVEIGKDTAAAATGELWAGQVPSQNFVFIYLGTGAGAGVVLGGEVMHGSSGNLGNFGHMSGNPDGARCPCGGRGCIGTTAMPGQLVAEALDAELIDPVDLRDARSIETGLAQLAAHATGGDADAHAILASAARSYGRVASNLSDTLDLDTIVFGGPHWRYLSEIFMAIVPDMINNLHRSNEIRNVTIRTSMLGDDVGPIGAASLVLVKSLSATPSHLMLPTR